MLGAMGSDNDERNGFDMDDFIEMICDKALRNANADCDIMPEYADATVVALRELLSGCEVMAMPDDTMYTSVLARNWIAFAKDYGTPGGSVGDYCGEAVVKAFSDVGGVTLRVDNPWITETLVDWINADALYPERELEVLLKWDIISKDML